MVVCDPREAQKGCRRALGLLTQLHTGATGDSRGAEGFGACRSKRRKEEASQRGQSQPEKVQFGCQRCMMVGGEEGREGDVPVQLTL